MYLTVFRGKSQDEDEPLESQGNASASFFTGSGYKLGSESTPASTLSQSSHPMSNPVSNSLPTAERILTFWKDGFSIDDGPLMRFDAPENQEFLEMIKSGYFLNFYIFFNFTSVAPVQYLNVQPGQKVEVKVSHKMEENYVEPPKKPIQPFSGQGNRLGSIIPGEPSTPSQSTNSNDVQVSTLSVDSSLPTTSIQVRLADGTRLVVKCNHHHQIRDLYAFIKASRPGESSKSFHLQTSLPVKILNDMEQTVKDAGLLNSVVFQRYI